jgi:L-iditol 2-dehydrogenase
MKAWVLHGINDLRLEDVPKPVPKHGDVLVAVKCAGICSSDVQRVFVSGAYHYPIILGHEFSGVTEDGRRVGVFPLLPCFTCESCKNKIYETCSDYSYIGSRCDGAFAEYVVVPDRNLIELPDDVTFEQGALLEPAAVALHAVKKMSASHVKNVAVVGDGTVGRYIVKWLEINGIANVTLLGRNTPPVSADVYFEVVGSRDALQTCVKNVTPNGQIILVGNPSFDFNIDRDLYWQFLRKQITIFGSWNSSFPDDWKCILDNMDKLKLCEHISHYHKFEEHKKTLEMIQGKKIKYGKSVLTK